MTAPKIVPVRLSQIVAVVSVQTHPTEPFASRIAAMILIVVERKPAWARCWMNSNSWLSEYVVVWAGQCPMGRFVTPMGTTTAGPDCAITPPTGANHCVARAVTAHKVSVAIQRGSSAIRFGAFAVQPIYSLDRLVLEMLVAPTLNAAVVGVWAASVVIFAVLIPIAVVVVAVLTI